MKRPPIIGLPAGPRPKCANCGKTLPVITDDVYTPAPERGPFAADLTQRTFVMWDSYGHFHSLRCAWAFAEAAHRAGFRVTP